MHVRRTLALIGLGGAPVLYGALGVGCGPSTDSGEATSFVSSALDGGGTTGVYCAATPGPARVLRALR